MSFFAAVILSTLRRLWRTSDLREEQIAIGLGSKMGNGLLACTLTWLVLEAEGAPEEMRVPAVAFLALVFGSVFLSLIACAGDIEITYRG